MEKNLKSMTAMQRTGLNVCFDPSQRTHVVAVFLDPDNQKNKLVSIPCLGVTVNGYAYDFTTDSYVVECVDWLVLGFIEASCRIRINQSYELKIPISNDCCERLLGKTQRRELRSFVKTRGYDGLLVEFLQTVTG